MAVESSEKWIEGITPDHRTSDVAALTLENRLKHVLHYLPLAAKKPDEDIEYVHHLRVWARRANAALCLYEVWMPRRRFSWMKKQLKRVRRAANDARDCDILTERLKTGSATRGNRRWRKTLSADRQVAQQAIIAVYDRLEHDQRLAKRLEELLERVRVRGEVKNGAVSSCFGKWARERLRPAVEAFFAAVPADHADPSALHQFRIRGKNLRYAMEVLAGAFADEFRTQLYPAVESMQERLGEVNDLVTAQEKLSRKIDKVAKSEKKLWRKLFADKQAQLDSAIELFWQWCTPQMLEELRGGFDALHADPIRAVKSADLAPTVNKPFPLISTR